MQMHTQFQVILKPDPGNPQELYLDSLYALGIKREEHDIRFVEDNWESPALGAWGLGWEVWLDGMENTQYTYFQQFGGFDADPVAVELTYGLERIAAFLQNVQSVYEIKWNNTLTYGDLRQAEELELSVYDFEAADPENCRKHLDLYEGEALRLLGSYRLLKDDESRRRFPLRKVYEFCLKCSHLFNILDARGAISVTERVALIARIRKMACQVAEVYVGRLEPVGEAQPA
jgi:tetrameric-type glycyl-tRNA synthetase alpha subunit